MTIPIIWRSTFAVATALLGSAISPAGALWGQQPPEGLGSLPDAETFAQMFLTGEDSGNIRPAFALCPQDHPWKEAVFGAILEANLTARQRNRAASAWARHTGRCADARLDAFIVDFLDDVRVAGQGHEVFGAVSALESAQDGVDLSPAVEAALRRIVFEASIDSRPSYFDHVVEPRGWAASVLLEQMGEERLPELMEELYARGAPPPAFWDRALHVMAGGSVQQRTFLLGLVTDRAPSGREGAVTGSVIAALSWGLRTRPLPGGGGFREEFRAAVTRIANDRSTTDRLRAAAAQALRELAQTP